MRRLLLFLALALLLPSMASAKRVELSQGWLFWKGDNPEAKATSFDDSSWRRIVAPHDWSIEDRPDTGLPFDPSTPKGGNTGYTRGGVGWYRLHLDLTPSEAHEMAVLCFEAVYMNSDVWVNGVHVARTNAGYVPFHADLSGHVHAGKNVVAVRVNHEEPSSRWYSGSGLIRPVHLHLADRLHADFDGPRIDASLRAGAGLAAISAELTNAASAPRSAVLSYRILDPKGREVARHRSRHVVAAGSAVKLKHELSVGRPALWSVESPHLYRVVQTLEGSDGARQRTISRIGFRTLEFSADRGFLLNGVPIKLRGGNFHHDNYMLGAAGFPRADERKVELLKAAGYNAIRSAHNPASRATLDAADRLGVLVINEAFDAWQVPKLEKDHARFFDTDWKTDLETMIATSRNHPSIIMWSIGNEMREQTRPEAVPIARRLAQHVRSLDPSRPVTQASDEGGDKMAALFGELDIVGYNYGLEHYAADHAKHPHRIVFGSESYPPAGNEYWRPVEQHPWLLGDFVWTAIDYLGEASIGWTGMSPDWRVPGPYPWHLAYCGEIDATGRHRPAAHYRSIFWNPGRPAVAAFVEWPDPKGSLPNADYWGPDGHREWVMPDIHPSWTWPGREGKPLRLVVYASTPEVEIRLNGRQIARRSVSAETGYQVSIDVPYEAGRLEALALEGGKVAARWTLETAGPPVAIRFAADRTRLNANGVDLAYLTAELVDAQGRPTYDRASDRLLTFDVSGAGVLAGVGNGNPVDPESFQNGKRTTYHGRAVAVLRSGFAKGDITVRTSGDGLEGGLVRFSVE